MSQIALKRYLNPKGPRGPKLSLVGPLGVDIEKKYKDGIPDTITEHNSLFEMSNSMDWSNLRYVHHKTMSHNSRYGLQVLYHFSCINSPQYTMTNEHRFEIRSVTPCHHMDQHNFLRKQMLQN